MIKNLDNQLALSMNRSSKVIDQLHKSLNEEKEKEIKVLTQVVDSKKRLLEHEKDLKDLHNSLLAQKTEAQN